MRRNPVRSVTVAALAVLAVGGPSVTTPAFADAAGKADAPPKANIVQRKAVEGRPGQEWLYPSVVVENTGSRRIGTERVLVEAPPEMLFMDSELTFTRYEDESREIHVQCVPSATKRTLTCPGVDLNLEPGRKWAVLYPAMSVKPNAGPGDTYVTFKLGSPVFAQGKSKVTVKR
ncbi:hypothetical protein [Streptomyces griseocarneus]|uniref:hypothetical protein n=1 Tax=Streptomyces griseocarneus TaxID=51201 RepID=UPI00167C9BCC|nr:hypothetical protein [Streptomyces griseocarneus]MBZ6474768.1 hypothetical protein [Streptomyces griseocarneus]GHG47983.1 hypothetical protein GCM10018779_05850 [Streptomyces griseocarneus]